MGYFHGYKGYRYYNSPSSLLLYSNFNELQAVYEFDMDLKAILYPQIMFLETTIKNYALENILEQSGRIGLLIFTQSFLTITSLFRLEVSTTRMQSPNV